MADTIRNELKKKYLAEGGLEENLTNDSQTIQGMVKAMTNPTKAVPKIGITAMAGNIIPWNDGIKISDMQSDVKVNGNKITGKLFKLTEGALVEQYGEGYFIGLQFSGIDEETVTSCRVGMNPSAGTGLVEVKGDPDQNGTFKVTNKTQCFEIHQTVGGNVAVQQYDLTGLVLA